MTATDTADGPVESTDEESDSAASPPGGEPPGDASAPGYDADRLVTFGQWTAFGVLVLLAFVATFRFYSAASSAIRIWFSSDFVPIFQAAFNLVVLLACVIGISLLVRRMRS